MSLNNEIRTQLQQTEAAREKMRREDPEKYRQHYQQADTARNKLSITDEIKGNFMRIGNAVRDPVKARQQYVDSMYAAFATATSKPTVMTLSEFKKFEPLYHKEYLEKCVNNTLTSEEENMISDLSQEFYLKVNLTAPLIIVDDVTKEEVLRLPPIFISMNKQSKKLNEAMLSLSAAHQLDDGVAGGIARTQIKKATVNVWRTLSTEQDWQDIAKQVSEIRKIRAQFEQKMHPELNEQISAKAKAIANPQAVDNDNADNICDFEPIDE